MSGTKISKLVVRNFRGIRALEVHAADINLFGGANAQGKTSVLDAIAAAMRGRVDPETVRHDAKRAEILVELDDGTQIHRKIPAEGKATVTVKKDMAILRSPQKFLDDLFADEGLDPIAFIRAKDRQKRLLEALPVETSAAEVLEYLESVGLGKAAVKGLRVESKHAFEVFEAVGKMLAEQRKDTNKEVKRLGQWIEQEQGRADGVEDPSEKIEAAAAALAEIKAKRDQAAERATQNEARIRAIDGQRAKLDLIQHNIDDARKRVEELEAAAAAEAKELAALEAAAKEAIPAEPQGILDAEISNREAALTELREAKGSWDELQRRLGELDAEARKLEELQASAAALNAGVKLFAKQAPAEALARTPMPVEGLEYRDGAFYVNGTHLDQLSGAETIRVAVQFTLERVRKKGLHSICVDGLETLDAEQRREFFGELANSGIQVWATEVDHGQDTNTAGDGSLYVVMSGGLPEGYEVPEETDGDAEEPGGQAAIEF